MRPITPVESVLLAAGWFLLGLFAVKAFAGVELGCTHKGNQLVTIQSGTHKGRTGRVAYTELVLGETFHRIEITETVRVREEELNETK